MRSTGGIVEAVRVRPSLGARRYLSKRRLNSCCYSDSTLPTHELEVEEEDNMNVTNCQVEKTSVSSDGSSTQALTDISQEDLTDEVELSERDDINRVNHVPLTEEDEHCCEKSNISDEDSDEEFWHVLRTASPQSIRRKRSCLKNSSPTSLPEINWEELDGNSTKKEKDNKPNGMRRSVSFGDVAIREYGVELGDNPSCVSGPAVTLSWDYVPTVKEALLNYEENRPLRRAKKELRLTHYERETILFNNGFGFNEVSAAVESAAKDKIRRMKTVLHFKYSRYEEKLEDACGRFLRLLHLRKNDEEMIKDLWEAASLDAHDEVRTAALRHVRQRELALTSPID